MRIPTVVIETDNGPVTINASDFNASVHKLATAAETPAPVTPAASDDQGGTTQPVALLVTKKGKKFIVVDGDGKAVERDGIDADGYATENDAWAAIMALNANG